MFLIESLHHSVHDDDDDVNCSIGHPQSKKVILPLFFIKTSGNRENDDCAINKYENVPHMQYHDNDDGCGNQIRKGIKVTKVRRNSEKRV